MRGQGRCWRQRPGMVAAELGLARKPLAFTFDYALWRPLRRGESFGLVTSVALVRSGVAGCGSGGDGGGGGAGPIPEVVGCCGGAGWGGYGSGQRRWPARLGCAGDHGESGGGGG